MCIKQKIQLQLLSQAWTNANQAKSYSANQVSCFVYEYKYEYRNLVLH